MPCCPHWQRQANTHQSQEGDAGAGEGGHVEAVGRQVLVGGRGMLEEGDLRQRWQ